MPYLMQGNFYADVLEKKGNTVIQTLADCIKRYFGVAQISPQGQA